MDWLVSESLESRLGVPSTPKVYIGEIEGNLISVKLSKHPKLIMVTDDVTAGLNLLNLSPNTAIIKYKDFVYTFEIPKSKSTILLEKSGDKLRVTLGAEIEKKK